MRRGRQARQNCQERKISKITFEEGDYVLQRTEAHELGKEVVHLPPAMFCSSIVDRREALAMGLQQSMW
jgi:hypothetical protein